MKRLLAFIFLSCAALCAQTNSARMLSGVNVQTGTSYTFVGADSTRITTFSNASATAVTLPAGGTANFGAGSVFSAKNIGAGTVTITCSSCTINSTGTASGTLALATGQNADLYSDGANYVAFVAPQVAPSSGAASPGFTFPTKFYYTIAEDTAVTNVVGGGSCFGTQALGVLPTATEPQGRLFTSTAVGSVNANAGCQVGFGANPGQGQTSPGLTARVSQRLMTQTTTSTRYWVGYTDGSSGTFGGSGFSTDNPNGNLCMFRHSDGTDVNWKAYCSTDSTHFTVVDTGVAVSTTASYIFEVGFTPSFAPTAANFYLNGNLVATISTNLPSASLAMGYAWIVDNKNTATATSTYFMWSQAIFNK
jgi:hypothetical protein